MSFPNQDILLSKDRSNPEIRVPISVTERTPITIPNAVKIDLVLFAKTAPKEILRFSKNKETTIYPYYPLLSYPQIDVLYVSHA